MNVRGALDEAPDGLKEFLRFLIDRVPDSELTERIARSISKAKIQKFWEDEYMLYEEKMREMYEEGIEYGFYKGRLQNMVELVTEGDISIERAAEKTDMSVEAFREVMRDLGFKLPVE